jgi:hypothetical protein
MSRAELQSELVAGGASLATHDIRWQIAPDWRHALINSGGLRWDEWRQAGLIRIVKQGAHRTVYLIDLPGRPFYLKHYHPEGFAAVLANRLRGSAARRELRNANELRRRGLSTAEPIGMGERRGGRESFFVSRAIDNACTIDEFSRSPVLDFDEVGRVSARRRVMVALAQLCAATHRAGVDHADFHAGNVLVELDTARLSNHSTDLPRLYWIDLPKMSFTAPLDWKRSCASLAVLAAGWLHRTTRTERQRFWNVYLAARGDLLLYDSRVTAVEVIHAARAHARRTLAGRDKRSLATNRDFVRLSGAEYAAHAAQGATPENLDEWIGRALAKLSVPSAVRRKGPRISVASQADWVIAGAPQPVNVQVIQSWGRLLPSFSLTPTIQQWRLANALRARRIHTPRPLCAVQPSDRRRPGLLVTERLAATTLDNLLPGPAQTGQVFCDDAKSEAPRQSEGTRLLEIPPAVRRAVAGAVGQLLGDLHAWNFTFFSVDAASISIEGINAEPEGTQPVAWLVKLAGVALYNRLTDQTRAIDLQVFLESLILYRVSRTDCLRSLRAYLAANERTSAEWKSLWRRVYHGSMLEEIFESRNQRRVERATDEVDD